MLNAFICIFFSDFTGFISDIVKEKAQTISDLESFLTDVVDPDLKWINCFRASEHGWAASTFHSRCDFKGPTLTLVAVKGLMFGGFTDMDWGGEFFHVLLTGS